MGVILVLVRLVTLVLGLVVLPFVVLAFFLVSALVAAVVLDLLWEEVPPGDFILSSSCSVLLNLSSVCCSLSEVVPGYKRSIIITSLQYL